MDNFKKSVDKLPTQVRVTFAGFTEPWLNPKATDMLLYADKEVIQSQYLQLVLV